MVAVSFTCPARSVNYESLETYSRAGSGCMVPFTSVTQPSESLRGAAGEVFRSGEARPLAADRPLRA